MRTSPLGRELQRFAISTLRLDMAIGHMQRYPEPVIGACAQRILVQCAKVELYRFLQTTLDVCQLPGPAKYQGIPWRQLQCPPKRGLRAAPVPLVGHLDP